MTFPRTIDWILFASTLPILAAGLLTMFSFTDTNAFFSRQIVWIGISLVFFFSASFVDWRFLRKGGLLLTLFVVGTLLLLFLFSAGRIVKGAQSWFDFGPFSFQPVESIKLILILILAKYFSRRHIEIAHLRHMLISGAYALIMFLLVLLQPDFGGAVVIFLIWFSMVLVSGVSKKHIAGVFLVVAASVLILWAFAFKEYQKDRIVSFVSPLADIHGSGYNANQSMIAIGSGGFVGRGVGLGSQSRLKFLPEYETDFIFAAFAEEWGFLGVGALLAFYGILLWRILWNARAGRSNFESLYALGLAGFIMSHLLIHIGMNLGLLPVTGISLPFMSYGGSNLVTLFLGLGILMGMRRYRRDANPELAPYEIPGVAVR
jgi:rod shape determining protein RodA